MFARLEMETHKLAIHLIQILMVNLLLLHIVEVDNNRAVADEHLEYQLIFSIEGLTVRLVCKLHHP